jgi:hypothetical protein
VKVDVVMPKIMMLLLSESRYYVRSGDTARRAATRAE